MKNITTQIRSAWRSIIFLSITSTAISFGAAHAQQVLQLVPGKPHSETMATTALNTKLGESLRIENLKINDEAPSVVNLELRRSEVVSSGTQYIVVDDKVINELLPERSADGGKAVSRLIDHQKDFVNREFSCGVTPPFLRTDPVQRQVGIEELLKAGRKNSQEILTEKAGSPRRADIIIDSDYELYQKFGTESATFNYITNLLTYISSRYQAEVTTRFNLKQIIVRTTSADPWSTTSAWYLLLI